jgi:hypothetical protein
MACAMRAASITCRDTWPTRWLPCIEALRSSWKASSSPTCWARISTPLGLVDPLALLQLVGQLRGPGPQRALVRLARQRQVHQRAQPRRPVALHHPGVHARFQCTLHPFDAAVLREPEHGHRLLGLQGRDRLQEFRCGARRPAHQHVGAARRVSRTRWAQSPSPRHLESRRGEVGDERGRTTIGRFRRRTVVTALARKTAQA